MLRTRTRIAIASVAAAAVAAGGGVALAGHSNEVVAGHLDGRQEVRDGATSNRVVGDPNGRGEGYVFGIDGDPTTLCYLLLVEGIADLDEAPGDGRAAHIHEGAERENGPVVAALAWPQGGDAADCLTAGEPGKLSPTGGQSQEDLVLDILADPEDYYFNVHNGEHPGGAIRGQLHSHG